MGILDDVLSIPGASGWLSQFLSNMGQQSNLAQSVNTGGYSNAAPQMNFNDRWPNLPPAGSMPLPPPITIGQLPQGGAGIPQDRIPNIQQSQSQIPPQAQLVQHQNQQAVTQGLPQQEPSLLERIAAGANNLAASPSLIGGIADSIRGYSTGIRTDKAGMALQNQKQMAQALYSALAPRVGQAQAIAIAQAAATDPKVAEVLLPQALGLKPPTTIEGVIAERMSRPGVGGQGQAQIDPYQEIQKLKRAEAEGQAAGRTTGETQATAEINLPSTIATAQEALRVAESLRSHPGRDNPLFFHGGLSNYLPDSAIPGNTDALDANKRLFQLKSGAFATAYQSLKGGGQISNVEGAKMTESLNRMDRAASRKEFDSALSDFEGILRLGIDRAANQAGKQAPYGFKGNQGQGVTASGIGWKVK